MLSTRATRLATGLAELPGYAYADLFNDDFDRVAGALNNACLASNVGKMWSD